MLSRHLSALLLLVMWAGCTSTQARYGELARGFKDPGQDTRPRAYWNWLNGDVTLAGLTRDLEEAKDKGLGGLEMWDTEAMRNPGGFVPAGPPFMGPESVAAMRHCMQEAKRLGLDLGLITSSGWNAGGPWIPPALASKNLFYSSTVVSGPAQIKQALAFPKVPARCPKGADGLPKWYQDVAVLAWPDAKDKVIADPCQVIDLTNKFHSGELTWKAPAGKWQVLRYVCTNNGQQLIAASPNSKGPFIDFLDPEATRFHFEYIIKKLGLKKGGDPDCPLKYLEVDSMELHKGIQWTPKFPTWFTQYHGYDPVAWLPALSGWTVKDRDTSARFVYDYRKTVSDLLIFSHYTTGSQVCAEYGLELAGEAGGPGPPIWNSCPVDALKALGNVDIPRGEFWIQSPRDIFLIKEIASAAHIYGKPYVDAEAWTTWRRWKDSPFVRKQLVDRAFCEGLNRITYHGYSHSPQAVGYPGRSYHAGVDMNPQVVWWSKARPFMDYLARCCHMLQQGLFVADVAYYYGDKAPNFWPPSARVPTKPRLEGLDAGYDYDVVNTDVILKRMSVKDRRIVFPDGMSYRVLVLPDQQDMPLEVLEKLEQLVTRGATIIGPKPTTVPRLRDYAARSTRLRALADRMWGPCNGSTVTQHIYGQGKVVWGLTPGQWLARESIEPDFACAAASATLDYIHRRIQDLDIYFVRNKSLSRVKADCQFRVHGRRPQLWDPTDGSIEPAFFCQDSDRRTRVQLDLAPGASVFVIFGKKTLANISDTDVWQCFENGQYSVTLSSGQTKQLTIDCLPAPRSIAGPWTVNFDPAWGAPAALRLPKLISWTEHQNEGVKYYSGAGLYTKSMDVPVDWLSAGRKVHLDLGDVRDVAEVSINGKSAGVLWKFPYRVDITSLVKPGSNQLQVEVMNLWINRLVGDRLLPPEKRFTRTNITSFRNRLSSQPSVIQPAGLLGPVRLLQSVGANVDGEAEHHGVPVDEQEHPNVVLIFADDLGYGDLGCYGATKVKTPNIDRLAVQGRMFTDAHSASAVCTPSRYALLTGEYPVRKNLYPPVFLRTGLVIDTQQQTIASVMKDAGYATACIGKWHLGLGKPRPDWNGELKPGPLELGFDFYFGVPVVNSHPPFVYVENHRVVGLVPEDPFVFKRRAKTREFPEKMGLTEIGGADAAHARYDDERVGTTLTEKAVAWIKAQAKNPFFLYLATTNIHHPFTPHPRFKGTSGCGRYGDFIHELDWIVGEILKTLDEQGVAQNTLVIFTSDNGGMFNQGGQDAWDAGHTLNGRLLGFKFDAWEGGHRVPFIARWPGKIPAGSQSGQLICNVDMIATLAVLAGIKLQPGQGRDSVNILPALLGEPREPIRDHLLLAARQATHLALRQGKWMYIGAQGGGGFTSRQRGAHAFGGPAAITFTQRPNSDIADGRIKPDAAPAQLYDLENDLAQTSNVYRKHPEVVKEMEALLGKYKSHTPTPRSERRHQN